MANRLCNGFQLRFAEAEQGRSVKTTHRVAAELVVFLSEAKDLNWGKTSVPAAKGPRFDGSP